MPVERLKSGNYRAVLADLSGKRRSETFKTERQAHARLSLWKREKRDGNQFGANRQTVQEFFEEWFVNLPPDQSGWRKLQLQYAESYFIPKIGQMQLRHVRPIEIQSILNSMASNGKSAQTQSHVFKTLRKMFGDAFETYQYIDSNPVLKKHKPKVSVRKTPNLGWEESRRLLVHVHDKPFGLAIWAQLLLGLRVSELIALRREDIDLQTGHVRIRRAFVRRLNLVNESTKSRKERSAFACPELLEMLRSAQGSATASDWAVSSKCGGLLNYKLYKDTLQRYCDELSIPRIGTHGLRHSASPVYRQSGLDPKDTQHSQDMQKLFGHASSEMTSRYLHDQDATLKLAASRIRIFPTSR